MLTKHQKHTKRPIWRILFGLFCFVLLALLLYVTQFIVSYQQYYNNAMAELNRIRQELAYQPFDEVFESYSEEMNKQYVQHAILLLKDEELSNEKLAAVAEMQSVLDSMLIFREDGTLLYSWGEAIDDAAFLMQLEERQSQKAPNGLTYLALPLRDDLYLAVGSMIGFTQNGFDKTRYDLQIIDAATDGLICEVAVANKHTGKVIYGPDSMIGKKLMNYLPVPLSDQSYLDVMVVDHSVMLVSSLEHDHYQLLAMFDFLDIFGRLHATIIPALLGFSFLIFLLLAYAEFIRTDMCMGRLGKIHYTQFGRKHYLNTVLLRKLSGFALIGLVCMICGVYCLQLLVRSDEQRENAENRLDLACRQVEEYQASLAEEEEVVKDGLLYLAKEIRNALALSPELIETEGLQSLSRVYGCSAIYVLDEDGKTIATNTTNKTFALSADSDDALYPFWEVISGFEEGWIQLVQNDPHSQNKDMMYAGVPREDSRGMILVIFPYGEEWGSYGIDTVLGTISVDGESMLLAVTLGSTNCVFDSSSQYTGLSLGDYGIKEEFLRSGYSGTHRFDGRDCLITARTAQVWNLLYITPTNGVSSSSWVFTALVVAIGLLVVIMAILPWLVVRTPGEDIRKPMPQELPPAHRSHIDVSLNEAGEVELVERRVEQHTLRKRWMEMNASEKLRLLVRVLLAAAISCALLYLAFGRRGGSHPLMDRILEQNWDKTFNVYALCYVGIVVCGIWLIARMLQNLTLYVTGTFSRRWETSGILISNVIRYAALIGSVFFTLQNFGVDTRTLITSASMLTLIFGLGSQSFVADMIAGVFLIFEGTFRVGDIVTIDNWSGEVVEIGLRSTKVKNAVGNVKIFQNSRISGAINMTSEQSFAVCDIALPAGEQLEAFEQKIITGFFPAARQSIRSIRHPLVYEGVVAVNGDNATLRVSVKCLEGEREALTREMYRALKLWREQQKQV